MLQQPWDRLYGYVNPLYLTPALLLEDGQVLYEMQELEQPDRELLRTIGQKEVAKNCMYLNALLADHEWQVYGTCDVGRTAIALGGGFRIAPGCLASSPNSSG
jgi:hypothetical protein